MKIEVGDRVRALKGCRMADQDIFYREGDTGHVVRFADGLGVWVKWDNNRIGDGVWYASIEDLTLIAEDMIGIDVLAVMDSAESVLRSNIRRCNNKASRGEPHQASLIKQQRAAYLLEHYAAARAAVADLSEAARCAADAIAVLLPLLSSEQREVVCDAIAGADEARADILRALARCRGGAA